MVRSIEGHGRVKTRYPPVPGETGLPFASPTSARIPGNGLVADPGIVVVSPAKGVMRIDPVSVCHQVSTIGQRDLPIFVWYQIHASGFIGSPTVPSSLREERSCLAGYPSPQRMHALMAVGAVYNIVQRYFSIISQNRSLSGKSGEPSYITVVAPLAKGPYTM